MLEKEKIKICRAEERPKAGLVLGVSGIGR